ncbi:MAG: sugar ABC transporter ATP-binding protein [Ruminiclostridium sp.]
MGCEFIRLSNISKKFGDHTVLNNINLTINKGEVCCFLGENGAGKSTLMKILYGLYSADSGDIFLEGEKVSITSPEKGQKLGIRMIFQESELIPELTVSQNIFLNNELLYKYVPFINHSLMDKRSRESLDMVHSDIDVKSSVKRLGYAQRQMVEIVKAITFNAKVIILDEPTSALLDSEVQNLTEIIKELKKMNVCILYISHNLEEIRRIADRIIVMKDGEIVDIKDEQNKFESNYFIEKMAGEDFLNRYPNISSEKKDVIFKVENLSNNKTVKNVNIDLHLGEIVGLAGLQGSGKSSVAEMIFGLKKKKSGKFYMDGKEVFIHHPWQARKQGMSYISEYVRNNVFVSQDTPYNLSISNLKKFEKYFFLNNKKIRNTSKNYTEKLYMKIPYSKKPIKDLSQGTLQKIALSKLLFSAKRILIMDEPSKDLDIPTKVGLYNIMNQLTRKGISILLISSDTEELIGMCNRIYIMLNGSIVKELDSSSATSAKILYYASGENDLPLQ